ncbi:MAG: hydrogenase [Proteobacteria bacterium]|nr:hydrogenase [Pseudomonadota bacterium]
MTLFILATILLVLSGFSAPFCPNGSRFIDRMSLAVGLAGSIAGISAVVICLLRPETATMMVPWPGCGVVINFTIDGLAAVFMLPAYFIGGAGLIYGSGYWPIAGGRRYGRWIRFFYPLMVAAIGGVLTAGNGLVFLICWEIMALTGYFLVVTEREDGDAHQAGFIFLAATHAGTLVLFALLGENACLYSLPAVSSLVGVSTGFANTVFLLAMFGFGFKAGIMPLHIWLPGAHAAAPSHVSALMSGVMIKTGIYGILRITGMFQAQPQWWGWLVLILGLISGILGVAFAIAQHDIKKLLAYHSIENIGIILIGIGAAMVGKHHGFVALAVLGMAGALLHVINHGLFKALLFMSAGSVINATGTRQMAAYGGLFKVMPFTGFFFLGGAVAICGLPPLNGFVSEWLIYFGLLQAATQPGGEPLLAVLVAVPGLAMVGGLALLCFAKVFGLTFLGNIRPEWKNIHEAPATMLTAMGLLLAACLWIGIAPFSVLPFLAGGVAWFIGSTTQDFHSAVLVPVRAISLTALLVLVPALLFLLARRKGGRSSPQVPTWGCGYSNALPRARYSTSSFAELIMNLLRGILLTVFKEHRPERLFSGTSFFRSHTPDVVLDLLLIPVITVAAGISVQIRRALHHGVIGIYLLYSAITLVVLLSAALLFQ